MESKKYTTGDRFMLLRKVKGFKQEEMADILKIDPKTLSKIENNEVQPKIDLIERFVARIIFFIIIFMNHHNLN